MRKIIFISATTNNIKKASIFVLKPKDMPLMEIIINISIKIIGAAITILMLQPSQKITTKKLLISGQ